MGGTAPPGSRKSLESCEYLHSRSGKGSYEDSLDERLDVEERDIIIRVYCRRAHNTHILTHGLAVRCTHRPRRRHLPFIDEFASHCIDRADDVLGGSSEDDLSAGLESVDKWSCVMLHTSISD